MRRPLISPLVFLALAVTGSTARSQTPADRPTVTLSLREAVDIAVARDGNTRVALATELVEQSRRQGDQHRAALLPQLDASISQMSTMRNLEAFGVRLSTPVPGFALPRIVGPFNVVDARLTASQSVFDLSAIRRFQAARLATRATRQQEMATGQDVTAEVARAYLTGLWSQDRVETAVVDVDLAEALVVLARNRNDAGAGTAIETTRAQVQLANERQNLLLRRQELRAAQFQLLRMIGLDLSADLLLTTRLEETAAEPLALEGALQDAFVHRADWKAVEQRLDSVRLSNSSVRWERLPSVKVFADYGTIGSSIDTAQPTRTYGISASIPLFDGALRQARRGESASRVREEELRAQDLRAQIEMEVRLAADNLESTSAQLQVAEQGALLAEDELARAQRRYKAGVGSSIEITDAQTRFARSRQNRLNALYALNLARVDFSEARGRIETVIP